MPKDIDDAQWTGCQAVIALPEHIDVPSLEAATAAGTLTLTVIRDVTKACRLADLADLARAAVAAQQAHDGQELLDSITASLYNAGLSLQAAADLSHDEVGKRIAEALQHLDDTIREIRDNAFTTRDQGQIELPAGGMQEEMWVSSPEPAAGGSVTPGACQARL